MKDACIKAVSTAAGRSLKSDEIKGILDTIKRAMRQLARQSQSTWVKLNPADRLQAAAKLAGGQLKQAAKREKFLVARKIITYDQIDNHIKENVARGNSSLKSLDGGLLSIDVSGKTTGESYEQRATAMKRMYGAMLKNVFESVNRKIFGLFSNAEGVQAFAYEIFGEDSSKIAGIDPKTAALAKQAAKAWKGVTDMARDAFNRAGGDIGSLGDLWHLPQNWSSARVLKMGQDTWVSKMMDRVDKRQYLDENGSYIGDQALQEKLKEAWLTISTKGAIRMEPDKVQPAGMFANRGRDPRVLFFKSADSYIAANAEFGGSTMYDAMMGHINKIASDTAAIEKFGPNPQASFRSWTAKALKDDMLRDPANATKYENQAANLQKKFDWMMKTSQDKPVSQWMATAADVLRDTMTACKLGIAPLTSANHLATMNLTASYLGLDHMQMMRNYLKAMNPTDTMEEALAQRFGLSMETYMNEMNHWAGESFGPAFTKYLANSSVRFSGLAAHLEAMRRAFGVTMYGSLGSLASKFDNLGALQGRDGEIMKRNGISEENFQTWKLAKQEDWGSGNNTMITPEAINAIPDADLAHLGNPADLRRDAILKMIGMVEGEVQNAVITPTATERFNAAGQFKRGTVMGELGRSMYMFKMVPQAQISRNLQRGMSLPTMAGKAGYIAAYFAATTAVSAMVVQAKNLAAGKDPESMMNKQFLTDAMLKGGALGIYADFILSSSDQDTNASLTDKLGGPVIGLANDLYKLAHGESSKFLNDKDTDVLSQVIKIAHNNIPLVQTWYTKTILDRLIFSQLQEDVNPGYMDRVNQQAAQSGRSSFYAPGQLVPSRMPNFSKALQDDED